MIQVLLIEDNADDIELAKRIFAKVGMADKVRVVSDGTAAIDYLLGRGAYAHEGAPSSLQLILLDLNLPKTPGLDVLHRIRSNEMTLKLPVVVLTVSRNEPDLLQSFTMGISEYIIKPLEEDRFVQIYRKYVKESPG